MTDRRRARLERKISEIPVPPPPAGLAERIKRDIPERLPASSVESLTELSPYRIWLRVAAILLVVVASSFVAMQLLVQDVMKPSARTAEVAEADMKRDVAIPPPPSLAAPSVSAQDSSGRSNVTAAAEPSVLQEAAPQSPARMKLKNIERQAEASIVTTAPAEEYEAKRREKTQSDAALEAVALNVPESVDQVATANFSKEAPAKAKDEVASREGGRVAGVIAGGVIGGKVRAATAPAPTAIAEAPAAPPSAVARKQSSIASARSDDARAAGTFYESRNRGFLDADEKAASSFPLSVGSDSYRTAPAHLREGRLPPPESVRVEEFVNYFQYDDPSPARGDFALSGEGSVSPFPAGPRYHMVRFGIRPRPGLGTTKATVEVIFNDAVVQRYRLLGYENRGQAGPATDRAGATEQIPSSRGVVALYEVKLKQNYRRKDTLATLRVSYQSTNNEGVVISKEIRAEEVEQAWLDAPRSIQLASIVATFAELLRGDELNRDVTLEVLANRARFVADRYPGNAAVKELVSLIETSARLKKTPAND